MGGSRQDGRTGGREGDSDGEGRDTRSVGTLVSGGRVREGHWSVSLKMERGTQSECALVAGEGSRGLSWPQVQVLARYLAGHQWVSAFPTWCIKSHRIGRPGPIRGPQGLWIVQCLSHLHEARDLPYHGGDK
jgi:hypothetical protein